MLEIQFLLHFHSKVCEHVQPFYPGHPDDIPKDTV